MPTIQHKRSSTGGAVPSAGSLAVGELGINLADRKIYTKDASGNVVKLGVDELTGPQVLSPDAFLHVRNEQTSGTAGGNSVGGAWTKVVLNTTKTSTLSGASLASSVLTLPAGNYYVKASAPFYKVARVKLRLRDTTAGATVITGTSEFTAGGDDVAIRPSLNGAFTLTATSNIELQYYCTNSQGTNGLGVDSGFDTEVFADVEIWQYVDILGAEYPIQSSQLSTIISSSVSSTSWADVPSTSLDFQANAGDRVLLLFSGAAWQSSNGQNASFVFNLDGTDVRSDATFGNLIVSYPTAGYATPVAITWVADIATTGVHTLKLRAKVSAGTISLGDGTNHPRQMQAIRLACAALGRGWFEQVAVKTAASTTSSSFVDIPDMSITRVTENENISLNFTGYLWQSSYPTTSGFVFSIDGVDVRTDTPYGNTIATPAGGGENISMNWKAQVSAGTHTFKVRWKAASGQTSYLGDGTNHPRSFSVSSISGSGLPTGLGAPDNVQSVTKTDTFSTTSSTPVSVTGLAVTITPSSSARKILLRLSIPCSSDSTTARIYVAIDRGGTLVGIGDASGSRTRAGCGCRISDGDQVFNFSVELKDSPGSTSPQTYTAKAWCTTGTMYVNRPGNDSDSTASGRFVSTLTAMEVV